MNRRNSYVAWRRSDIDNIKKKCCRRTDILESKPKTLKLKKIASSTQFCTCATGTLLEGNELKNERVEE